MYTNSAQYNTYHEKVGTYIQGLRELCLDDVITFNAQVLQEKTPDNQRYVQDLLLYTLQNLQIYVKTDAGRFATGMDKKLYDMDKLLSTYKTQEHIYAKSA